MSQLTIKRKSVRHCFSAAACLLWLLVPALLLCNLPARAGVEEVIIEVPVKPKIDISDYNSLMVGNFICNRDTRVELDTEIVRYLRKMMLRTLEIEISRGEPPTLPTGQGGLPIFEVPGYWSDLGGRFDCDLILSGAVSFSTEDRSGYEQIDLRNTRQGVYRRDMGYSPYNTRTIFLDKTGFFLNLEIHLLNGRTGEEIYTDKFYQEIIYDGDGPDDLSVFFMMMDKMAPQITGIVAERKTRVTRYLLH
jgi:hypothetical protein